MKFYAAENVLGFANTWSVLVFDSKAARDSYVNDRDGYDFKTDRHIDCRAIKKSEVTNFAANLSLTGNRKIKPRPFTDECWMIGADYDDKGEDISGFLGNVFVGVPGLDCGERLFG